MATFSVQEPFGYYPVTAEQTTGAQSVQAAAATNKSTAWLAVSVGGDETEVLGSPHLLWLPLVKR